MTCGHGACERGVGLKPGEADEGGVMESSFDALGGVVGLSTWGGRKPDEGGEEQRLLEIFVATLARMLVADTGSGAVHERYQTRLGGELSGGTKGRAAANFGQHAGFGRDREARHREQGSHKTPGIDHCFSGGDLFAWDHSLGQRLGQPEQDGFRRCAARRGQGLAVQGGNDIADQAFAHARRERLALGADQTQAARGVGDGVPVARVGPIRARAEVTRMEYGQPGQVGYLSAAMAGHRNRQHPDRGGWSAMIGTFACLPRRVHTVRSRSKLFLSGLSYNRFPPRPMSVGVMLTPTDTQPEKYHTAASNDPAHLVVSAARPAPTTPSGSHFMTNPPGGPFPYQRPVDATGSGGNIPGIPSGRDRSHGEPGDQASIIQGLRRWRTGFDAKIAEGRRRAG